MYKRQGLKSERCEVVHSAKKTMFMLAKLAWLNACKSCLLYTSDAADDRISVDLGGRRIIKKIFFKQKTAYEIRLSLVGSEMCIRDRK